jgi:cell division protein FtsB
MMRSPHKSPEHAPARRFLRVPPREERRKRKAILIGAGAALAYLLYTYIGTDSGILRILDLRRENEALRKEKLALSLSANEAELGRKAAATDPLSAERVARERFHMVKRGEILYRYRDPSVDSAR